MRDFSFKGYGFLPFGKRNKGEQVLSLKDQLIERLEQRFKEQQAYLRFIKIGSLAMNKTGVHTQNISLRDY